MSAADEQIRCDECGCVYADYVEHLRRNPDCLPPHLVSDDEDDDASDDGDSAPLPLCVQGGSGLSDRWSAVAVAGQPDLQLRSRWEQ